MDMSPLPTYKPAPAPKRNAWAQKVEIEHLKSRLQGKKATGQTEETSETLKAPHAAELATTETMGNRDSEVLKPADTTSANAKIVAAGLETGQKEMIDECTEATKTLQVPARDVDDVLTPNTTHTTMTDAIGPAARYPSAVPAPLEAGKRGKRDGPRGPLEKLKDLFSSSLRPHKSSEAVEKPLPAVPDSGDVYDPQSTAYNPYAYVPSPASVNSAAGDAMLFANPCRNQFITPTRSGNFGYHNKPQYVLPESHTSFIGSVVDAASPEVSRPVPEPQATAAEQFAAASAVESLYNRRVRRSSSFPAMKVRDAGGPQAAHSAADVATQTTGGSQDVTMLLRRLDVLAADQQAANAAILRRINRLEMQLNFVLARLNALGAQGGSGGRERGMVARLGAMPPHIPGGGQW